MIQQVFPLLVRNLGLSFYGIEIDVILQHSGEGIVFIFHCSNRLVEHIADIVLKILQRWNCVAIFISPRLVPASTYRNEEGFTVRRLVLQQFLDKLWVIFQMCKVLLNQLFALEIEFI